MSDEPTLQVGSHGPWVAHLQQILQQRGFLNEPADGVFGEHTHHAVCAFQHSASLTVDGIVGPHTWMRLGPGALADNPVVAVAGTLASAAAHGLEIAADAVGAHGVAQQVHTAAADAQHHAATSAELEHARMSAPKKLDIPLDTYETIRTTTMTTAHQRLVGYHDAMVEAVNDFSTHAITQIGHLHGNPPSQYANIMKSVVDVAVTIISLTPEGKAAEVLAKVGGSVVKGFFGAAADRLQGDANARAAAAVDAAKKHLEVDLLHLRSSNEQAAAAGLAAGVAWLGPAIDAAMEIGPVSTRAEDQAQLADAVIDDPALHSPKAMFLKSLEVTWADIFARAQYDVAHDVETLERKGYQHDLLEAKHEEGLAALHARERAEQVDWSNPDWNAAAQIQAEE